MRTKEGGIERKRERESERHLLSKTSKDSKRRKME